MFELLKNTSGRIPDATRHSRIAPEQGAQQECRSTRGSVEHCGGVTVIISLSAFSAVAAWAAAAFVFFQKSADSIHDEGKYREAN